MKELYTSPEMKLVCFAPAEKLAGGTIDFEDLFGLQHENITLGTNGASEHECDLDVEAYNDDNQ